MSSVLIAVVTKMVLYRCIKLHRQISAAKQPCSKSLNLCSIHPEIPFLRQFPAALLTSDGCAAGSKTNLWGLYSPGWNHQEYGNVAFS